MKKRDLPRKYTITIIHVLVCHSHFNALSKTASEDVDLLLN